MGLGLAAALAPGRADGPPALPADGAHDSRDVTRAQQRVTEQALRRQEKLFERGGATHAARAGQPRA